MAEFNRFDIAEAHCVLEWDYNDGGWLQERPSNQKRMESTGVQLAGTARAAGRTEQLTNYVTEG